MLETFTWNNGVNSVFTHNALAKSVFSSTSSPVYPNLMRAYCDCRRNPTQTDYIVEKLSELAKALILVNYDKEWSRIGVRVGFARRLRSALLRRLSETNRGAWMFLK